MESVKQQERCRNRVTASVAVGGVGIEMGRALDFPTTFDGNLCGLFVICIVCIVWWKVGERGVLNRNRKTGRRMFVKGKDVKLP